MPGKAIPREGRLRRKNAAFMMTAMLNERDDVE